MNARLSPEPHDVAALRRRLQAELKARYAEFLQGARRVVLVDFPNVPNVGDSAIWLGQKAMLAELGVEVLSQTERRTYSAARLRRFPREVPILIHGGGNMGDIWPAHERLRLSVVRDFPRRRIVQLPQSVHYSSERARDESARVLRAHGNFTPLARDRNSLAILAGPMGLDAALCPDSALAIDIARRREPVVNVLCLKRTDRESDSAERIEGPDVEVVDWLEDAPWWGLTLIRQLERIRVNYPRRLAFIGDAISLAYNSLASRRLERGLGLLSRGRVVVTDRLHAHLLCLLCGIPHVLVDNNYGKLSAFHEAWTAASPLTWWADDFRHAVALARELAQSPVGLRSSLAETGTLPVHARAEPARAAKSRPLAGGSLNGKS